MGLGDQFASRHPETLMSALGQKQTCRPEIAMSALPPKADIAKRDRDVRFSARSGLMYRNKKLSLFEARSCVDELGHPSKLPYDWRGYEWAAQGGHKSGMTVTGASHFKRTFSSLNWVKGTDHGHFRTV